MRRLRNQAQLCTRTLPLALALYALLLFVGRVQSVSLVSFLAQMATPSHDYAPAGVTVFAEHEDDKKSYTSEWDEDDDFHSPLRRFHGAYTDVSHLLHLQEPAFVFVSPHSKSLCCRGPPRV